IQAAAGNRAARMAASTAGPDLPLRRTPLPNVRTSEVAPASTPAPEARHSPHRPHAEDRRKIGIEKVAANATALAALGGDYGITWPQSIRYTHGARLEGSSWVLTVSDLIGEYSVQARILGHQADIPDASVATAGNYQALVAALNTL